MACKRLYVEQARRLLLRGADPNIVRYDGAVALLLAVIGNSLELAQLLIAHGANVCAPLLPNMMRS
jgi:ankyrin repeat protein